LVFVFILNIAVKRHASSRWRLARETKTKMMKMKMKMKTKKCGGVGPSWTVEFWGFRREVLLRPGVFC